MGMTMTQKILARHAGKAEVHAGELIKVKLDLLMANDTGFPISLNEYFRSGAKKVYVIYRRSREEMPAYGVEVDEAIAEGVEFMYLTNPVKVIGDKKGHITGLECVKMELGEPDESGRRRPQPIEGSNFTIDVDRCVMAIGTTFDKSFTDTLKKVKVSDRGAILVKDDSTETSHLGVFAGGDNVTGPATVIKAMGAGKKAASEIDYYLQNGPGLR